ncbi:MAG: TldD/PmbA family protein [Clostridia bacterium]|nr:TldD/PmbA family protein [Clostridia bacterium]
MLKFKEGFYADARVETVFTTSIKYRDGALEESKNTTVKKAFLRVFDGEMWYYASTYKLDDLQGELDKLYANATPNKDILKNETVKRFESNFAKVIKFDKNCVKDKTIAEKGKMLTDKFALLKSEHLKMFVAVYSDKYSEIEFYSSKGADIKYDFQLCGIRFMASFADGENNFTSSLSRSDNEISKIAVSDKEVKDFVSESEKFLYAKPVTAGEYPVILSPETAGVFAHESFGHKSEADFMIGDETMRKEWAIGKKVGSDILSIYDSGLEDGSGYRPYDDEGTKAKKTYLIKNGVLSGRLHSAATATDLGEAVTGNARAISCDFEPIVRMTSTIIEAGSLTKEKLFAGVKHGYFIKDYKHGSGMSTFTIAPNFAYEIVNGKIGDPVKIAVITGNVFETLNLIDGLSDKAEIISSAFGGCGKMEQFPLSVSFGGPYVRISKMSVQ